MSITELSVKKPIALIMIVLLVMGLGILGYTGLGADLFPSVDSPFITVITTYPGAGAEEIEKAIVKPVENAISGISGIDSIRSTVSEGYCFTNIKFKMETSVNNAFMDVQQAVNGISSTLPKDASKPVLKKFDKNAQPIMMLTISGSMPYEELYNNGDKLKQNLEKLRGVGQVTMQGAYKKELSVKIDKTAMEYYGLTINSISNIIQGSNLNIPAGQISGENKNQTIRIIGEFDDISKIKNLTIPLTSGGSIPLFEIAEVLLEYPNATNAVRFNGVSSIGIFIQKQSDANIVETTKIVRKELEQIKKSIPSDVKVDIAKDSSTYINSTLKQVNMNLIEGIITTSIIMFLFLKQMRSSLIVLVAIPTSLIATFFMMYILHFTLNMLTLLALSVSIGILVDDSIVVLENILRHLKQGKSLKDAAIDGRKEIAMAAIAITMCDIVVFGPVAFMSDMIGKFFREFGLTVVFATTFSLIVSFTITPMLASRLLKIEGVTLTDVKKKTGLISTYFDCLLSRNVFLQQDLSSISILSNLLLK